MTTEMEQHDKVQPESKKLEQSWEGRLFVTTLVIARGLIKAGSKYACYYDPVNDNRIQAVTSSMIADHVQSTPKVVAIGMRHIGFDLERKAIKLYLPNGINDDNLTPHNQYIWRWVATSEDTWKRMLMWYFGNEDVPLPRALRSMYFVDDVTVGLDSLLTPSTHKPLNDEDYTTIVSQMQPRTGKGIGI